MTRLPLWALTALVSLFSLTFAPATAAQALVQIRLAGEVAAPPSGEDAAEGDFGHLVEIEVDATPRGVEREVVLHLHVAAGTTGIELLQLVAAKLRAAEVGATLTLGRPSADGAPKDLGGSLWVEGATRVHLRLGGGLLGEVSCVEGPPQSIRVHPASAIQGPTQVHVSASTAIIMKDRAPIRGRATFTARLEKAVHAAEAATALWEAATDKWVSDRPGADAWRPIKMASGAALTGVSVRLNGQSDWAVEVAL